jgi:hypothetical protein
MQVLFKKELVFALLVLTGYCGEAQKPLVYNAGKYIIYRDSIVQGNYVAKTISAKEIVSNYKSPANEFKSADITFKFSINGKDNEMKSGIDHHFVCEPVNGYSETPIIKFGQQLNQIKSTTSYLAPNTNLKIRVDMRDVFNEFKTKGYYTTFNGDKIYRSDFKGVYVAGSSAPLIWDFNNLVNHPKLQLHDDDGDGIYEVTLKMNGVDEVHATEAQWKQSKDISVFPSYTSEYKISDAIYNLAIEEMINAVEPDSTFRTGKEWAGVWTRDISYSIILSMAHLQPQVAKYSLLRKVNKKKKIIQDTGTGGAWPVSTDRMIWAVAAWELYKVTGDKDWLQQAYVIIKNSIEADLNTCYDKETGLVKGESSFLDWREQTYPKWMQPVDIAESECLGTNAVHYQANIVLSKMASVLNEKSVAAKHLRIADKIKTGINKYLWQPQKKYYGQFLYGRNYKILSPRSEALGGALSVIFGIANSEQQKQIVSNTPLSDFGITCIYPQIPGIPPYHNNAVWPFVQSYWLWAAAKTGNEKAAMESIAAIYRPAALFATDKENFVASNGDFLGTQINSSNMLWSLSGSISIVHKVLFGIRFNQNSLSFEPFVPKALQGKRSLTNFKYRNAVLNIEMKGYGSKIERFYIDGHQTKESKISADLKGMHAIKIILANNNFSGHDINKVPEYTSLSTPEVVYNNGRLQWQNIQGVKNFKLVKNGKPISIINKNTYAVKIETFAEYQVIAIDNSGVESFASEPVVVANENRWQTYELENYSEPANYSYNGFLGKGFIEISTTKNTMLSVPVTVKQDSEYSIDFRYANGNGPMNTENKCAMRTLKVDGKMAGTSLFPQRGKEEWSNWGYSNSIKVHLSKGKHKITLIYENSNENMNGTINQSMLDNMRLMRIGN